MQDKMVKYDLGDQKNDQMSKLSISSLLYEIQIVRIVRSDHRCSDRIRMGPVYSVLLASSSLAVNCYFPLIKIGVSLEPIKSALWIDSVKTAVRRRSFSTSVGSDIFG